MTEERKNRLLLDAIKEGDRDLSGRLNEVLRVFGHEEVSLGREIAVSDLFSYGLAEGVQLRKHDAGKCIISSEKDGFYFAVSEEKSRVIPRDLSLENISRVMNNDFMSSEVGYHKQIKGNPSRLFGGASYFMLKDKEIFIFDESGDFGRISMPVLKKCFEGTGIKVVGEYGQNPISLEDYILRYIDRDDIRGGGFSGGPYPIPDDDIPF